MSEWTARRTASGGAFLVSEILLDAGLRHAFTLRPSSVDCAGAPPDPSSIDRASRAPSARRPEGGGDAARPGNTLSGVEPADSLAAAGARPQSIARPRQVHGAVVARPGALGEETLPAEADAVLVDRRGGAAAIATADCVGGILTVRGGEAFVVLHAGWRGILAGIVEASVAALSEAVSARPSEMLLSTGPAVHGCCYEVGEEVEERFAALFTTAAERAAVFGSRSGRCTLDPPAAVRLLAGRAGLPPGAVHDAGTCTMCRSDVCWSHRAHGRAAGRMWTAAALDPA